jgi:DNA-binding CsgD family transcriptional regulator
VVLAKRKRKTLTAREQQVLNLIGRGHTSKQIATRLNLSILTIGNHRKQICKKLGVHSTAELAAYAAGAKAQVLKNRGGPTPCTIVMRLGHRGSCLKMTYQGHLSDLPSSARVRIGETTFNI